MKKLKNKKIASKPKDEDDKFYCSLCGREISEEEYETYDGMFGECWEIEMDELDYEGTTNVLVPFSKKKRDKLQWQSAHIRTRKQRCWKDVPR